MTGHRARGPYAKTAAKRRKILDAALAAYAEAGSRGVSVRDIAERVGMTDAGVLHHFGSREELLTAVIQARDIEAAQEYTAENVLWRTDLLAENAETPGLVKLFLDLAAAAAEPDHPAHEFFTERYRTLRHQLAAVLLAGPPPRMDRSGSLSDCDADWAARVLLAATDGLQLQWLLDPSIDMAGDVARLRDVVMQALEQAGALGDDSHDSDDSDDSDDSSDGTGGQPTP